LNLSFKLLKFKYEQASPFKLEDPQTP
jgi:hypothetical protein